MTWTVLPRPISSASRQLFLVHQLRSSQPAPSIWKSLSSPPVMYSGWRSGILNVARFLGLSRTTAWAAVILGTRTCRLRSQRP